MSATVGRFYERSLRTRRLGGKSTREAKRWLLITGERRELHPRLLFVADFTGGNDVFFCCSGVACVGMTKQSYTCVSKDLPVRVKMYIVLFNRFILLHSRREAHTFKFCEGDWFP